MNDRATIVIRLNEDRAVRRVLDLIAVSGGSCQEQAVSAWIQKALKDAGVPISSISVDTAHKKSPAVSLLLYNMVGPMICTLMLPTIGDA